MPRLPAWLIYLTIVAAMLVLAVGRREHANAPQPPPPPPFADQAPIAPSSPFANTALVRLSGGKAAKGTAFSISDRGVWLTARTVVAGCASPVIAVAEGWAAPAKVRAVDADTAVLTTDAGAPALPVAAAQTRAGDSGFVPGFSDGGPGELSALFIGRGIGRDRIAWAEIGHTDGLKSPFSGLAGAPVLSAAGAISGMLVAEAPRRGRLRTTTPEALVHALTAAKLKPSAAQADPPITLDNYGRAADSLRRALSVAEVMCLN